MVKNNIFYLSPDSFVDEVPHIIYELIKSKIANQKVINIALSGGNTPIPILNKLTQFDLDWERINFFMVDERCVSIDNEQSNYGNISKIFFEKITTNSFSVIKDHKTYEECATEYENLINEKVTKSRNALPAFDFIFLGMGCDGHTASLFPETEGLNEKSKLVFLNSVPQLNTNRITFSYSLILNAKEIIVLASGEDKIKIVKEIYNKESDKYPISKIIYQHKNLRWYLSK